MKRPTHARRGTAAIEMALVFPVLIVLVCGTIVGGTGVFRHQQVQCLACEAARWSSTRGGDYQKDLSVASPTAQQIVDQAVIPKATGMNPADLDVKVEWVDRSTNTAWDWDAAPKDVRSVTAAGEYISNTVRVTVTYRWGPGMLWGATPVRAVSEMPLSN